MTPESYRQHPNGLIPNSRFPLLVHRNAVPGGTRDALTERFSSNGWLHNWSNNGLFTFGHFHSIAHECLGVADGWMEVELFGPEGETIRLETGDVAVLPAGVSHRMVSASSDVQIIGGYADGRDWDNVADSSLTEANHAGYVDSVISVPIPNRDPATGEALTAWQTAPSWQEHGLATA